MSSSALRMNSSHTARKHNTTHENALGDDGHEVVQVHDVGAAVLCVCVGAGGIRE